MKNIYAIRIITFFLIITFIYQDVILANGFLMPSSKVAQIAGELPHDLDNVLARFRKNPFSLTSEEITRLLEFLRAHPNLSKGAEGVFSELLKNLTKIAGSLSIQDMWNIALAYNAVIEARGITWARKMRLWSERNFWRERIWNIFKESYRGKERLQWNDFADEMQANHKEFKKACYGFLLEKHGGNLGNIGKDVADNCRKIISAKNVEWNLRENNLVYKWYLTRALKKVEKRKGKRKNLDIYERSALIHEYIKGDYRKDPTFPSFRFKAKTKGSHISNYCCYVILYERTAKRKKHCLRMVNGVKDVFGEGKIVGVETVFDNNYGWLFRMSKGRKKLFFMLSEDRKGIGLIDPVQQVIIDAVRQKTDAFGRPISAKGAKLKRLDAKHGRSLIDEMIRCNKFTDESITIFPFGITSDTNGGLSFRNIRGKKRYPQICGPRLKSKTDYEVSFLFSKSLGRWVCVAREVYKNEKTGEPVIMFTEKEEGGQAKLCLLNDTEFRVCGKEFSKYLILKEIKNEFEKGVDLTGNAEIILQEIYKTHGIRRGSKLAKEVANLFFTYSFFEVLKGIRKSIDRNTKGVKDVKAIRRIRRNELKVLRSNQFKNKHSTIYARLRNYYKLYKSVFEKNSAEIAGILGFEVDYERDICGNKDTVNVLKWLKEKWRKAERRQIPKGFSIHVGKSGSYSLLRYKKIWLDLRGLSEGDYWLSFSEEEGGRIKYAVVWEDEDTADTEEAKPIQKYKIAEGKNIFAKRFKEDHIDKKPELLVERSISEMVRKFVLKDGEIPPGESAKVKGRGTDDLNGVITLCGFKDFQLYLSSYLSKFVGKTLWITFEKDSEGNKFAVVWENEEISKTKPYGYLRKYYIVKKGIVMNQRGLDEGGNIISTKRSPVIFTWKNKKKVIVEGKEIEKKMLGEGEEVEFLIPRLLHPDPNIANNVKSALMEWLKNEVGVRKLLSFMKPDDSSKEGIAMNSAILDILESFKDFWECVPEHLMEFTKCPDRNLRMWAKKLRDRLLRVKKIADIQKQNAEKRRAAESEKRRQEQSKLRSYMDFIRDKEDEYIKIRENVEVRLNRLERIKSMKEEVLTLIRFLTEQYSRIECIWGCVKQRKNHSKLAEMVRGIREYKEEVKSELDKFNELWRRMKLDEEDICVGDWWVGNIKGRIASWLISDINLDEWKVTLTGNGAKHRISIDDLKVVSRESERWRIGNSLIERLRKDFRIEEDAAAEAQGVGGVAKHTNRLASKTKAKRKPKRVRPERPRARQAESDAKDEYHELQSLLDGDVDVDLDLDELELPEIDEDVSSHKFRKDLREGLEKELAGTKYIDGVRRRGLSWADKDKIHLEDDFVFEAAARVLNRILRKSSEEQITPEQVKAVAEYHEMVHIVLKGNRKIIRKFSGTIHGELRRKLFRYFTNQYGKYTTKEELIEELIASYFTERMLANSLEFLDDDGEIITVEDIDPRIARIIESCAGKYIDAIDFKELKYRKILSKLNKARRRKKFRSTRIENTPPVPVPTPPALKYRRAITVHDVLYDKQIDPENMDAENIKHRSLLACNDFNELFAGAGKYKEEVLKTIYIKQFKTLVIDCYELVLGGKILKRFPNGFWKGEKGRLHQIIITRYLFEEKLGFKMDEKNRKIDKRFFRKGQRRFLRSQKVKDWEELFRKYHLAGMMTWTLDIQFSVTTAIKRAYPWAFDYNTPEGKHIHYYDFPRVSRIVDRDKYTEMAIRHVMERHWRLVNPKEQSFDKALSPKNKKIFRGFAAEGLRDIFRNRFGCSIKKMLKEYYLWVFDLSKPEGKHLHEWEFKEDEKWTGKDKDEMIKEAGRHIILKHLRLSEDRDIILANINKRILEREGLLRKMFTQKFNESLMKFLHFCFPDIFPQDDSFEAFLLQYIYGYADWRKTLPKYQKWLAQMAMIELGIGNEEISALFRAPFCGKTLIGLLFFYKKGKNSNEKARKRFEREVLFNPKIHGFLKMFRKKGETPIQAVERVLREFGVEKKAEVVPELGLVKNEIKQEEIAERIKKGDKLEDLTAGAVALSLQDMWKIVLAYNDVIEARCITWERKMQLWNERNFWRERIWKIFKEINEGREKLRWMDFAKEIQADPKEFQKTCYDYLLEKHRGDLKAIKKDLAGNCNEFESEKGVKTRIKNGGLAYKWYLVRALKKIDETGEELDVDEVDALIYGFIAGNHRKDPTFPSFWFKTKTRAYPGKKNVCFVHLYEGTIKGEKYYLIMFDGVKDAFGGGQDVRVESVFFNNYGWLFKVSNEHRELFSMLNENRKGMDLIDFVQQVVVDAVKPNMDARGMPISAKKTKLEMLDAKHARMLIREMITYNKFTDENLTVLPFKITSNARSRLGFRGIKGQKDYPQIQNARLKPNTEYEVNFMFSKSLGRWVCVVCEICKGGIAGEPVIMFTGEEKDRKTRLRLLKDNEFNDCEKEFIDSLILEEIRDDFRRGVGLRGDADRILSEIYDANGVSIESELAREVAKLFFTYRFFKVLKGLKRNELKVLRLKQFKKKHGTLYAGLLNYYESYKSVFEENKAEIAEILGFEVDYDIDICGKKSAGIGLLGTAQIQEAITAEAPAPAPAPPAPAPAMPATAQALPAQVPAPPAAKEERTSEDVIKDCERAEEEILKVVRQRVGSSRHVQSFREVLALIQFLKEQYSIIEKIWMVIDAEIGRQKIKEAARKVKECEKTISELKERLRLDGEDIYVDDVWKGKIKGQEGVWLIENIDIKEWKVRFGIVISEKKERREISIDDLRVIKTEDEGMMTKLDNVLIKRVWSRILDKKEVRDAIIREFKNGQITIGGKNLSLEEVGNGAHVEFLLGLLESPNEGEVNTAFMLLILLKVDEKNEDALEKILRKMDPLSWGQTQDGLKIAKINELLFYIIDFLDIASDMVIQRLSSFTSYPVPSISEKAYELKIRYERRRGIRREISRRAEEKDTQDKRKAEESGKREGSQVAGEGGESFRKLTRKQRDRLIRRSIGEFAKAKDIFKASAGEIISFVREQLPLAEEVDIMRLIYNYKKWHKIPGRKAGAEKAPERQELYVGDWVKINTEGLIELNEGKIIWIDEEMGTVTIYFPHTNLRDRVKTLTIGTVIQNAEIAEPYELGDEQKREIAELERRLQDRKEVSEQKEKKRLAIIEELLPKGRITIGGETLSLKGIESGRHIIFLLDLLKEVKMKEREKIYNLLRLLKNENSVGEILKRIKPRSRARGTENIKLRLLSVIDFLEIINKDVMDSLDEIINHGAHDISEWAYQIRARFKRISASAIREKQGGSKIRLRRRRGGKGKEAIPDKLENAEEEEEEEAAAEAQGDIDRQRQQVEEQGRRKEGMYRADISVGDLWLARIDGRIGFWRITDIDFGKNIVKFGIKIRKERIQEVFIDDLEIELDKNRWGESKLGKNVLFKKMPENTQQAISRIAPPVAKRRRPRVKRAKSPIEQPTTRMAKPVVGHAESPAAMPAAELKEPGAEQAESPAELPIAERPKQDTVQAIILTGPPILYKEKERSAIIGELFKDGKITIGGRTLSVQEVENGAPEIVGFLLSLLADPEKQEAKTACELLKLLKISETNVDALIALLRKIDTSAVYPEVIKKRNFMLLDILDFLDIADSIVTLVLSRFANYHDISLRDKALELLKRLNARLHEQARLPHNRSNGPMRYRMSKSGGPGCNPEFPGRLRQRFGRGRGQWLRMSPRITRTLGTLCVWGILIGACFIASYFAHGNSIAGILMAGSGILPFAVGAVLGGEGEGGDDGSGRRKTVLSTDKPLREWIVGRINGMGNNLRILSVGSETGDLELDLKNAGHDVTCTHVAPKTVKYLAGRGLDAVCGDACVIRSLLSDEFDIVIYPECIGYLKRDSAYREARKVLKEKGRIIIITYPQNSKLSVPGYEKQSMVNLAGDLNLAGFGVDYTAYIGDDETEVDLVEENAAQIIYAEAGLGTEEENEIEKLRKSLCERLNEALSPILGIKVHFEALNEDELIYVLTFIYDEKQRNSKFQPSKENKNLIPYILYLIEISKERQDEIASLFKNEEFMEMASVYFALYFFTYYHEVIVLLMDDDTVKDRLVRHIELVKEFRKAPAKVSKRNPLVIREGKVTLDIGAGLAGIQIISEAEQEERIYLLDNNPFICKVLEKYAELTGKSNVRVIDDDMTVMSKIGDGEAAVVIAEDVLGFDGSREKRLGEGKLPAFLQQIKRILTDGGEFRISFSEVPSDQERFYAAGRTFEKQERELRANIEKDPSCLEAEVLKLKESEARLTGPFDESSEGIINMLEPLGFEISGKTVRFGERLNNIVVTITAEKESGEKTGKPQDIQQLKGLINEVVQTGVRRLKQGAKTPEDRVIWTGHINPSRRDFLGHECQLISVGNSVPNDNEASWAWMDRDKGDLPLMAIKDAVTNMLFKNNRQVLSQHIRRALGKDIDLDNEVEYIWIDAFQEGNNGGVFRVEVHLKSGGLVKFGIISAKNSGDGSRVAEDDFANLMKIRDLYDRFNKDKKEKLPYETPEVYQGGNGKCRVNEAEHSIYMFLVEWLEDFYEASPMLKADRRLYLNGMYRGVHLLSWDFDASCGIREKSVMTAATIFELTGMAPRVHYGAGDFVVSVNEEGKPDSVRLITIPHLFDQNAMIKETAGKEGKLPPGLSYEERYVAFLFYLMNVGNNVFVSDEEGNIINDCFMHYTFPDPEVVFSGVMKALIRMYGEEEGKKRTAGILEKFMVAVPEYKNVVLRFLEGLGIRPVSKERQEELLLESKRKAVCGRLKEVLSPLLGDVDFAGLSNVELILILVCVYEGSKWSQINKKFLPNISAQAAELMLRINSVSKERAAELQKIKEGIELLELAGDYFSFYFYLRFHKGFIMKLDEKDRVKRHNIILQKALSAPVTIAKPDLLETGEGEITLDVGTGFPGISVISEAEQDEKIWLLDKNPFMVKALERYADLTGKKNITILCDDVTVLSKMPKGANVTTIVCEGVIEYEGRKEVRLGIDKLRVFFGHAKGVLKEGGILRIAYLQIYADRKSFEAGIERIAQEAETGKVKRDAEDGIGSDLDRSQREMGQTLDKSSREVCGLLREAGFEIIDTEVCVIKTMKDIGIKICARRKKEGSKVDTTTKEIEDKLRRVVDEGVEKLEAAGGGVTLKDRVIWTGISAYADKYAFGLISIGDRIFNEISWSWRIGELGDLPLMEVRNAVTEMLLKDSGKALAGHLERALKRPVNLEEEIEYIWIDKFQEGIEAGVFRVEVHLKTGDPVRFGIICAKNDKEEGGFVKKDRRNLEWIRTLYDGFNMEHHNNILPYETPEVYAGGYGDCVVGGGRHSLYMFMVKWIDNVYEVNPLLNRKGELTYRGLYRAMDVKKWDIEDSRKIRERAVMIAATIFELTNGKIPRIDFSGGDITADVNNAGQVDPAFLITASYFYNDKSLLSVSKEDRRRMAEERRDWALRYGLENAELDDRYLLLILHLLTTGSTVDAVYDDGRIVTNERALWKIFPEPEIIFSGITKALIRMYGEEEGMRRATSIFRKFNEKVPDAGRFAVDYLEKMKAAKGRDQQRERFHETYEGLKDRISEIYPHWELRSEEEMYKAVSGASDGFWAGLVFALRKDGSIDERDFLLISRMGQIVDSVAKGSDSGIQALLTAELSKEYLRDFSGFIREIEERLWQLGYGDKAGEIISRLGKIEMIENTGELKLSRASDYHFIIELERILGYEGEEIFNEILVNHFRGKVVPLTERYLRGDLPPKLMEFIERKLRSKSNGSVTLYESFRLFKEGVRMFKGLKVPKAEILDKPEADSSVDMSI